MHNASRAWLQNKKKRVLVPLLGRTATQHSARALAESTGPTVEGTLQLQFLIPIALRAAPGHFEPHNTITSLP